MKSSQTHVCRLRTGIYEGPPRTRERRDGLVKDVDLKTLSPRTLNWLASCYLMVGASEENDRILETALNQYPHDLMVAHFAAYTFELQSRWQESARMYHRCLVIRDDVPGIWKGLAKVYREIGEKMAAEKANAHAALLENQTLPTTIDSK